MRERRDIEAEVTERMIAALERGTVPWQRPWTTSGIMPTSAATGKPYRGVNVWLTSLAADERGYSSPYWLTFRQAGELGGSVRKGEKGTLVVFWKMLEVRDQDAPDGVKRVPLLRHYFVFNLDQCEGVTLPPRFRTDEREPVEVGEAMREILAGYVDGPEIRHVLGERAYYCPSDDRITLPLLEQFATAEGFAETALHELTHSTGHASRLDRFDNGEPQHFGDERYAREELVAEMGAAMLAAVHGIETSFDNSAAYVASWLRALRDDDSLVIRASQQAQRATDRIVGTTYVNMSATRDQAEVAA
jgi:antirestriction protein ArdC